MRLRILIGAVFAATIMVMPPGPRPVRAQSDGETPPIKWIDANGRDFKSSEELQKRSCCDDWDKTRSVSRTKPILFFFYWPVEDKKSADKSIKSQAANSGKFEKVLKSESVREEAKKFTCVKVNLRVLKQWGSKGEVLAKKYGVRAAPTLVFYDKTGCSQGSISRSTNEAVVTEKLKFVSGIGAQVEAMWSTADAMDFNFDDKKTFRKRSVFEDWNQARQLGEAKPMIFFFYWPTKDKNDKEADKEARKQAKNTQAMKEALEEGEVAKQLKRFYCFKVDVKELLSLVDGEKTYGPEYLIKYRVKAAPVLIIYDYQGNRLERITGKQKASSLARKLKKAADKSDKKLRK